MYFAYFVGAKEDTKRCRTEVAVSGFLPGIEEDAPSRSNTWIMVKMRTVAHPRVESTLYATK